MAPRVHRNALHLGAADAAALVSCDGFAQSYSLQLLETCAADRTVCTSYSERNLYRVTWYLVGSGAESTCVVQISTWEAPPIRSSLSRGFAFVGAVLFGIVLWNLVSVSCIPPDLKMLKMVWARILTLTGPTAPPSGENEGGGGG